MKINNISPFMGKSFYSQKGGKKRAVIEPKIDYARKIRPKNSQEELDKINAIRKNLKSKIEVDNIEKYYTLFYLMDEIARVKGTINPDIYDIEASILEGCAKNIENNNLISFRDCFNVLKTMLSLKLKGENLVNFLFLAGSKDNLCKLLNNPCQYQEEINEIMKRLEFINSKK